MKINCLYCGPVEVELAEGVTELAPDAIRQIAVDHYETESHQGMMVMAQAIDHAIYAPPLP